MFNDLSTPLTLLATRRSGKPRDMVAPGPTDAELDAMLAIAARVPDHGKLAPWRFVIVGADRRDALAALLSDAYRAEKPAAGRQELAAMDQFARQAPASSSCCRRRAPTATSRSGSRSCRPAPPACSC